MLTVDDAPRSPELQTPFRMTRHAELRTGARRCGLEAIEAALTYGRVVHVRGAEIHAIGRKEVIQFRCRGIDLRAFEGVQVVCQPGGGLVLTVYRNRDFRGLRPYRHHLSSSRLPLFSANGGIPAANN